MLILMSAALGVAAFTFAGCLLFYGGGAILGGRSVRDAWYLSATLAVLAFVATLVFGGYWVERGLVDGGARTCQGRTDC